MRDENGMLTPDAKEIARNTFKALFDILEEMCNEQQGSEFKLPEYRPDEHQATERHSKSPDNVNDV